MPDGRALVQNMDTTFPNAIQAFRRMQVKDKAAFLEYCIESNAYDVLEQIDTAYARDR